MDKPILRLRIQDRLAAGRLPYEHPPRVWGGLGHGETCDGCGESIATTQMGIEILDATRRGVQLHVACFHVWEVERQLVTEA